MVTSAERLKILQLIGEGKVSAEEGARLIAALGTDAEGDQAQQPVPDVSRRSLRILITDRYTGRAQVDLRLPFGLVDWAARMGAHFIPRGGGLDLDEMLDAVRSGTTGTLVDAVDDDEGRRIVVTVE